MDASEANPVCLEEHPATLAGSEDTSIPNRFLAHISRETSSGRFIPEMDGLRSEWACSSAMVEREGAAGAARFVSGKGRHGDFGEI